MIQKRFDELFSSLQQCIYTKGNLVISLEEGFRFAYDLLSQVKAQKGLTYVIGNGGSAGIASHFCTDLVKALEVPAMTLFDSNLLTCLGNDYGYEHVFSVPIKTMGNPDDVLVAISSSGKSPNIVNAALMARKKGLKVITLSGFSATNPLRQIGDLNFFIDKADYGFVEMSHFCLLHTLVDLWKEEKFSIQEEVRELIHAP
ncbi:MAG: SIS domain-containing protein [Chlamydiota bacterium]